MANTFSSLLFSVPSLIYSSISIWVPVLIEYQLDVTLVNDLI